jgi:radical SAM superfamily enzyme YgiQ (UPF0313 family)
MKIMLINPPALDSIVADMSDFFDRSSGAYPPLGLMYIASSVSASGQHEVRILDAAMDEMDYEDVSREVATFRPDVVGITTLTFNLPSVMGCAAAVKAGRKDAKVVLGGPHVAIYPDDTLSLPGVDYVVIGEGEIAFPKLVKAVESGAAAESLESVGFKTGQKKHLNRQSSFIEDLDALPFPAMGQVNAERYFSVLSPGKRTMVMMSSRGCPFKCIYCDRPHLGRKFRGRSAINVVDEMETYVRKHGIRDIKFFDDTFTVNRQRVVDICNEIRRRNLEVTWSVRARVNTVDGDLLRTMKQAGLISVSFGIESGNQATLDRLQKGTTVEQAVAAVGYCRNLGIEVLGDFILGCPGEGRQEVEETIRFATSLGIDYAQFTVMTPYPATQLYREGLERKVLPKDYWAEFAVRPDRKFVTPVWTEVLTKDELVGYLKKAYRSFYFRPGYIWRRLRRIGTFSELARKLSVFLSLLGLSILPVGMLAKNFKGRNQ